MVVTEADIRYINLEEAAKSGISEEYITVTKTLLFKGHKGQTCIKISYILSSISYLSVFISLMVPECYLKCLSLEI